MLTAGVAVGLAAVELNPAGFDVQLYVYVPEPPLATAASCTVAPAHTVPGVAVGVELKAPPLIPIVIASVLEQPVTVDVAVNVKIVVDVKFTVVGSSTAAFTSCEEGVQL